MEAVHEYGGIDLDSRKPLSEVVEGYTYFRNGDVIVAKITPCFENGKGALATDLCSAVGFGTTELHVLRPSSHVAPRFLLYLTFSDHFRRIGAASMYGAGGQKRISDEFIRNFRHPVPSLPEQRVIADFLDRETAKIDGLVARKERLIELLQEKRTALITRAVTRGLDPNVPMKDSGVEWLGEIPAHWELKPLKRLLRRSDYGISESLRVGGDIRVLTMAHIQDGEIVLPQDGSISGIDRTMVLESGDLLFIAPTAGNSWVRSVYFAATTMIGDLCIVPCEVNPASACRTRMAQLPTQLNWRSWNGTKHGITEYT